MKKSVVSILLFCATLVSAQANQWFKVADSGAHYRSSFALTYDPAANHFVLTVGAFYSTSDLTGPYIDQALSLSSGRWMNLLPAAELYGVWVDSFGVAAKAVAGSMTYNPGSIGSVVFVRPGYNGNTYLRPTTYASTKFLSFGNAVYRPADGCTYHFWAGTFARYNNTTRLWDTLSGVWRPSASWRWGSVAYDAHNDEIVLCGGGNVDTTGGHYGTRVYSFSTGQWSIVSPATQPPPRANAGLCYDAQNRKIVLFGGDHLDSLFSDTWVYDCATRTWEQRTPSLSPSPRFGHSLLYLPKSRSVILLGGNNYTSSPYISAQYKVIAPYQMWKYDVAGNRWSLVKPFLSPDISPAPVASMPQIAAVDTADNVLLAVGRGATWEMACDPSVEDAAGTASLGVPPGPALRRTGCWLPEWFTEGVAPPDTAAAAAALRNLPPDTWTNLNPVKRHGFQHFNWGTTVYDPDHDLILSWNGGHSTHPGNQVQQYSVAENRIRVGYDSEQMLEANFSNTSNPHLFTFNGRPFMNVHTYKEYVWNHDLQRMLIVHDRTYLYDPVRMDFDTTRIPNHAEMSSTYARTGHIRTPTATYCWSYAKFFALDSGTRAWRKLPASGSVPSFYADNSGFTWDSRRNRLLLYVNGTMMAYDIATGRVDSLKPGNTRPGNVRGRELVYVASEDKAYFPPISSTAMMVYHCGSNVWETYPISLGAGVVYSNVDGTSPSLGLMWDERRELFYIGMDGRFWLVLKPGGFTASERSTVTGAPGSLSLGFSNPYRPGALFHLTGTGADAAIRVTDIRGREVVRLPVFPETRVSWDGRDKAGRAMANGLYTVRAEKSMERISRKLVLIR